ncbi:hypothetical protein BXZ70DRAFT_1037538 [Cristinia sonorae]|uniref:C2H2-type domain-containing protein n=1 Tax=Cristinia sonorae TaxID=1940300 RepID=A0A8K0XTX0_9AGAR|nr:hypothetical protein BXZ70DRAFT_1037538 [Cristinia sonorae]
MSSWSTSAYPPRGRSRSRSPYRGGGYPPSRPSYSDNGYTQDPYRNDWDGYERDRAWPGYERERPYEHGRRGRSRSPPAEEGGRKRRRSMSPWERDRYDPRPRYGDDFDTHSRGYGYASPHRGHPPPPYGGNRRAPQDPHTMDYPASLKQYADWFRYYYPQQAIEEDNADKAAEQEAGDGSKPRNGIRTRWEKYRKEFTAQQMQRMFDYHRKSPWFAEKYDPSPQFVNLRARVRKVGWRGKIDAFVEDLDAGKFDPDLRETEQEQEPTSPMKNPGTNGADVSQAGIAETSEEVKPINGDDEMQFGAEPEDDPNDPDGNRGDTGNRPSDTKRGKFNEELAVEPEGNQVMIRTIPPDIGRVKLENACAGIDGYVYLALGDPMQKRNYYRGGWFRFRDDADMSSVITTLSEKKIEGFKLHVSQIVKPFVGKVRYAPDVASKPERLAKDLETAKALVNVLEEQAAALRKPLPPVAPEETLTANGDDTAMQDPHSDQYGEDPEPRERGSDAVERRVEKIMSELPEQGLLAGKSDQEINELRTVIALDLYLAYLRAAFHTCYYCAVVTDHSEELQRKCVKHVRKPLSKKHEVKALDVQPSDDVIDGEVKKEEDEKDKVVLKEKQEGRRNGVSILKPDDRWLEWLDSKMALLIDRSSVDPRDYGGKHPDEELTKAAEPYIKQEDEGKFRCKTCQKLFKATSFVEKHIANKHPDLVKHLEEIPYYNNFALDPHRIQPFTHPPPQVGNSQPPPPQAYGLSGPTYAPPPDYSRAHHAQPFNPAYPHPNGGGFYDPYMQPPAGYAPGGYPPPRRDESVSARRLSDRISGYAPLPEQSLLAAPASAGLPAKPVVSLDAALPSGSHPVRRGNRGMSVGGPPPPPPPDAKEDPRAAAGKRVSYHDMDLVAEGDVELTY